MNILLVNSLINLSFSAVSTKKEIFLNEYNTLGEQGEDPMSKWLKLARAKGETAESDPILLNLIVELYKKVDSLERYIKNEEPNELQLDIKSTITSIGFEHFRIADNLLHAGATYYARVALPIYPKREIGIFFEALDTQMARITKIHGRDEKEWNGYVTSRERVLIRQAKEDRE